MSARLNKRCHAMRQQNHKALVTYCVAGDYSAEVTVPIMRGLVAGGADIIELGFAFSDPMAEGPSIQAAHQRVLDAGTTDLDSTLELVAKWRDHDSKTPLVLMGYTNPVQQYGFSRFAKMASKKGVDALLLVDLPFEEGIDYRPICHQYDLELIPLIAPTTSLQRTQLICTHASGFLYCIALKGVTGSDALSLSDTTASINKLKTLVDIPIYAGFGIKTIAQVKDIAMMADGIVLGTVIVDKIEGMAKESLDEESVYRNISDFVQPWRTALNEL